MPFEPLSMNVLEYATPLNVVVKLPNLSVACACAPFSELLDWVPMPNIMDPDTVTAPLASICGKTINRPLLSCGNRYTGFCICSVKLTDVTEQPEAGQL